MTVLNAILKATLDTLSLMYAVSAAMLLFGGPLGAVLLCGLSAVGFWAFARQVK